MIATNLPAVKVHRSITAAAEIGDIIKAPFVPVMRVIGKKRTEAECHLIVAPIAATCQAEEWVIPLDAQTEAQQELTEYLEEQAQEIATSEIEIDSASGVYRVWEGMSLIGIFYRCCRTGLWVAEPRYVGKKRRYKTAEQAQDAIVRPYQHRSSDVAQKAIVKAGGMRHG